MGALEPAVRVAPYPAHISSYSQVLKCLTRRTPSSPVRKNGCRHGKSKSTTTRNHTRDRARGTHPAAISLDRRHIHTVKQGRSHLRRLRGTLYSRNAHIDRSPRRILLLDAATCQQEAPP